MDAQSEVFEAEAHFRDVMAAALVRIESAIGKIRACRRPGRGRVLRWLKRKQELIQVIGFLNARKLDVPQELLMELMDGLEFIDAKG